MSIAPANWYPRSHRCRRRHRQSHRGAHCCGFVPVAFADGAVLTMAVGRFYSPPSTCGAHLPEDSAAIRHDALHATVELRGYYFLWQMDCSSRWGELSRLGGAVIAAIAGASVGICSAGTSMRQRQQACTRLRRLLFATRCVLPRWISGACSVANAFWLVWWDSLHPTIMSVYTLAKARHALSVSHLSERWDSAPPGCLLLLCALLRIPMCSHPDSLAHAMALLLPLLRKIR